MEFWLINSYGYPSPFGSKFAIKAWEVFCSFCQYGSYQKLKEHWNSKAGKDRISPHGIESWKATLEEFGLVYVLSRTNEIVVTPGGQRLKEAGEKGDELEFAKVGVTLLLRYPLAGPPRRKRGKKQDSSDILLYWFIYACMLELGGFLYRSEIDFILSRVFYSVDIPDAINIIQKLRSGEVNYEDVRKEFAIASNSFYNTMNQVIVHASMNYLLWDSKDSQRGGSKDVKYSFKEDIQKLVTDSMGGAIGRPDCEEAASFLTRMPSAPKITDEKEYFEYLGAPVTPLVELNSNLAAIPFNYKEYSVLKEGTHYTIVDSSTIRGNINQLCKVAVKQKVILSHNLEFSYIIEAKVRRADGEIDVKVRSARPITNQAVLTQYLEDS
jgi:hypothetical protein